MGVRHECPRDGDRQLAGVPHLRERVGLEIVAPDLVGSIDLSRDETSLCRGAIEQQARKPRISRIVEKRCGGCCDSAQIIQNGHHAAFRCMRFPQNLPGRVSAAACRNPNLCQVSCFHGAVSLPADPTLTR